MKDYIKQAVRTEAPHTPEQDNRAARMLRGLHAAIGLGTEAGEMLDAFKKYIFYGKALDIVNLKEELGDLFWYMALMCDEFGLNFEDIQKINIEKLRARYPDKFTEYDAENRDLVKEREILEQPGITTQEEVTEAIERGYPEQGYESPKALDLFREVSIKSEKWGYAIEPEGKYLVLRLDGTDKRAHACRQAARTLAKELYQHKEFSNESNHISQMIIVEQEKQPPLKRKSNEQTTQAQG